MKQIDATGLLINSKIANTDLRKAKILRTVALGTQGRGIVEFKVWFFNRTFMFFRAWTEISAARWLP